MAAPGGIIIGIVLAKLYLWVSPRFAGTLGGTLFEFIATFGVWVIADRLHLSAILAVVAFAMTIARTVPERQSPRDRIHSYAVWETTVFLMNVLAFLLMGLQARAIILRFDAERIWQALAFAAVVVAVVIVVRLAWVMLYNVVRRRAFERLGGPRPPTVEQGVLVSWCGMRGLVTLATALALPLDFPARDLIVLSAFAVVVGTLKPDEPIPPVRQLAGELGVNPNTVKQAYQELERLGVTYVERGNGTYVAGGRALREDRASLATAVAERALHDATRNGLAVDELIDALERDAKKRNARGRRP